MFTYELLVDGHYDNFYVLRKDGVKFGHIFLLTEGKKEAHRWTLWVGSKLVATKKNWIEAWNVAKAL